MNVIVCSCSMQTTCSTWKIPETFWKYKKKSRQEEWPGNCVKVTAKNPIVSVFVQKISVTGVVLEVLPEPMFSSEFQFCHQSVLCICYDYVLLIFVIIEKNQLFLQFYKYNYLYFTIYTQIYLFFKGKNLKSCQFTMKICQFTHTHVLGGTPCAQVCIPPST